MLIASYFLILKEIDKSHLAHADMLYCGRNWK